jgi:diacylglycerol kinase family enzyme
MSRLLIIYNPNSTNFKRVKKEILDQKETLFDSYDLAEYTIKKIGFENNVKALKKELKDGDVALALGGDATAAISANAILESEKDVTLSVLPYGNFNDLARTLNTMKLKDLNLKSKPIKLYPLGISVDGKFWRYATCYVTIGMTAEAVELFDAPKFRKYMQKGHKSSWRSYLELCKWYFKNRHKKIFLPEFTINQKPVVKKASDYAAVNGKSMCRVMKGGDDFKKPHIFRSKALKTISFPRLFVLMTRSILHRTPGDETKGDLLEFTNDKATVELQAEGEYQIFKDIKKIEVKKSSI